MKENREIIDKIAKYKPVIMTFNLCTYLLKEKITIQ